MLHSLEVFCPSFHSYNIQDSIARISSEKNETQIIYYRSSCSKNVRPEIPYQNTIVQVVSHYMLCTTVPAQIERRRSNFRLGFFGEDFTK